jgi:hypothetical protein
MPRRRPNASPAKPSVLRDLICRIREKWVETLIGTVISLSIAGLGFFGKEMVEWSKRKVVDISNVSDGEALAVAREVVGSSVIKAVPFKDKGSADQFILVVSAEPNDPDAEPGMPLRVLEGRGSIYQVHGPDLEAFDLFTQSTLPPERYISLLTGIVDVERNGIKQVFAVYRDGGSSGYSVEVKLYDPLANNLYEVFLSAEDSDTMVTDPKFSTSVSQHKEIRAWLTTTANTFLFPAASVAGSYDHEVAEWRQAQGFDFELGTVRRRELPGQPPGGASVACQLQDREYEWISIFKGGVFGYDKSRNVHFLLFVPYDEYEWIDEMHASEKYLWMTSHFGDDWGKKGQYRIYDKSTQYLSKVTLSPKDQQMLFANTVTCGPFYN